MKSFYDFAQALQVSLKTQQLYSPAHPKTLEALRGVHEAATRMTLESERLRVAQSRGKTLLNGLAIESTMQTTALLHQLEERRVHGFVVTRGITAEELTAFVRILAMKPQQIESEGGAAQILSNEGVNNLRFLQVRYEEMLEGEEIVPTGSVRGEGGPGDGGGSPQRDVAEAPIELRVKDMLQKLLANLGDPQGGVAATADSAAGATGVGGSTQGGPGGSGGSTQGGPGGSGGWTQGGPEGLGGSTQAGAAPAAERQAPGSTNGTVSPASPPGVGTRARAGGVGFGAPGSGPGVEGQATDRGAAGGIGGAPAAAAPGFVASVFGGGAQVQRIAEILSAAHQFSAVPEAAAEIRNVLQQAVRDLDLKQQALLIAAIDDLPPGPIRSALEEISPEIVANVGAREATRGSIEDLSQMLERLLKSVPHRDRALELLELKLKQAGLSPAQLNEIFEFFAFESLPFDQKVEKIAEGHRVFEIPTSRLLTILSHLLSLGKISDFLKLVDLYGRGLFDESTAIRSRVADGFAGITAWTQERPLPAEVNAALERLVLTHFLRETDPTVHERATHAFENLIGGWITSGAIDHCYRTLVRTDAGVSAAASALPWKREAFDQLLDRMTAPVWLSRLLPLLYHKDPDTMTSQVGPLLVFLGERAAVALLGVLADEEDRSRRARLVRAIRDIGKPALPPLRRALASDTWYVVRNALNLLGDLGAYDLVEEIGRTLKHSDERVRRAAVRTLGKLRGPAIEKALVEALAHNDPETQIEILHALGTLRARSAVGTIQEFLRNRRLDEKVRSVATELAAQLSAMT